MDKVIRGILNEGKVRIFFADTSSSCLKICQNHNLGLVATDALSRVLSVAAIMGAMQKDGKLTIKIDANGPLKCIIVDADSKGNIRGFVGNPDLNDDIKKVKDAIGDLGILTVIKDLGMKQNFSSQVVLQSGEVGEDFSFYFKESEQTDSVVSVGTVMNLNGFKSGAFIIQLMPGSTEVDYQYVEAFTKNCPPMSEILKANDLEGAIKELLPEVEILGESPVSFNCNCSKERFIDGISTLSIDEIQSMIAENHEFEVFCNFCGKKYTLTIKDLNEALNRKRMGEN